MSVNDEFIRWVEYTICEKSMDIFYKTKSTSTSFHAFSERLRLSLISGDLSKLERNILESIMVNTNRLYSLPIEEISVICADFYINKRWQKYIKAIKLMENVKWKLPDKRFKYF